MYFRFFIRRRYCNPGELFAICNFNTILSGKCLHMYNNRDDFRSSFKTSCNAENSVLLSITFNLILKYVLGFTFYAIVNNNWYNNRTISCWNLLYFHKDDWSFAASVNFMNSSSEVECFVQQIVRIRMACALFLDLPWQKWSIVPHSEWIWARVSVLSRLFSRHRFILRYSLTQTMHAIGNLCSPR